MANLRDITQVPELEALDGSEKVLLNVDGAAKQARVDLLKPKKELVYEWNFSIDDEVGEVFENVNEDLSWLTQKQEGVDFDIVIEVYGYSYKYSNNQGEYDFTFHDDMIGRATSQESSRYSRFTNTPSGYDYNTLSKEALFIWLNGQDFDYEFDYNDASLYYEIYPAAGIYIENGIHYNDDYSVTSVEVGGSLAFYSDDNPFKSIKVYKITD